MCELLANGFRIANMELGRASCGSLGVGGAQVWLEAFTVRQN